VRILCPCLRLVVLTAALIISSHSVRAQQTPSEPDPQGVLRMTLDHCVALALAQNTDVLTAVDEVAVAESQRSAARGQLVPKIHVDGSFQQWNEAYVFDGLPVHDVTVWNVTASVTQPITGLLAIYEAYKVRDLGVDVAAVRREATRRQVALGVIERYYRLLQAERLTDVAVASVDQLGAQRKQATSFHANGVVSRDDVLRAELAVANAEQRLIQARARVTLERGHLAVIMGMHPDSPIDAQPLPPDLVPSRQALSLELAEQAAEARRVELREVDKRIEQANHETHLAYLKLIPQVNAVGAFIHNEGSLLSQTNSGYVGGVASWDVWDPATTMNGVSEAKARAHQALLARIRVDNAVHLEVRQAYFGRWVTIT